jgi:hypothetical protein
MYSMQIASSSYSLHPLLRRRGFPKIYAQQEVICPNALLVIGLKFAVVVGGAEDAYIVSAESP